MALVGEKHQRIRLHALSVVLFGVALALAYRLTDLQFLQHDRFAALARDEHLRDQEIPAHRGALLDTNGNPLAVTTTFQTVDLIGADIRDPVGTAALVAPLLEMRAEDFLALIDQNSKTLAPTKASISSATATR